MTVTCGGSTRSFSRIFTFQPWTLSFLVNGRSNGIPALSALCPLLIQAKGTFVSRSASSSAGILHLLARPYKLSFDAGIPSSKSGLRGRFFPVSVPTMFLFTLRGTRLFAGARAVPFGPVGRKLITDRGTRPPLTVRPCRGRPSGSHRPGSRHACRSLTVCLLDACRGRGPRGPQNRTKPILGGFTNCMDFISLDASFRPLVAGRRLSEGPRSPVLRSLSSLGKFSLLRWGHHGYRRAICSSACSRFRKGRSTPTGWPRPAPRSRASRPYRSRTGWSIGGVLTWTRRSSWSTTLDAELTAHGGDPEATLAGALDGRCLEAHRARRGGSIPRSSQADARAPAGGPGPDRLARRGGGGEQPDAVHAHPPPRQGGHGPGLAGPRRARSAAKIALKELRPDQADNSGVCSRFLDEARVTAQLEHPGIVPVYELGEGGRAVLHDAVRQGPHAQRGDPCLPQGPRGRRRPIRSGLVKLLSGLRRGLPRRGLRPLAGRHPPRPQGPERGAGGLRRGHRAGLGPGQAGRGRPPRPAGRAPRHAAGRRECRSTGPRRTASPRVGGRRRRLPPEREPRVRLGVPAADRVRGRPGGDHAGPVAGHAGLHGPRAGRGRGTT